MTLPTPDIKTPLWRRWGIAQFFADYSWFLLKNLIGWVLILASPWVGMLLPGPGGVPLFLIGFALVSFPGKRRLTARVLRGRKFHLLHPRYQWIRLGGAIVLPIIFGLLIAWRYHGWFNAHQPTRREWIAVALVALGLGWLATYAGLRVGNGIVGLMPKVRRMVRPWMRRRGINLLPPRRIRRAPSSLPPQRESDEILAFHHRHMDRVRSAGSFLKRSAKQLIGVAITAAVVIWFVRRIAGQWDAISQKVQATSFTRILLAAVMFALFLLVFRAVAWRRILEAFGRRVPLWPATRVWSTSELARYVPGAIWQVVGRVYLIRPYGVNAATCSTSQVLELAIFVLANIFTALICLPWFAPKMGPDARPYLYATACLAPLLLLLLHPRIFLGTVNRILTAAGKMPFTIRLQKRLLSKLMLWNMLGLAWQGLALWVLMSQPDTLGLSLDQLPLIIGA